MSPRPKNPTFEAIFLETFAVKNKMCSGTDVLNAKINVFTGTDLALHLSFGKKTLYLFFSSLAEPKICDLRCRAP
jgi:hypothetical protein